jgi:hypothetical protein
LTRSKASKKHIGETRECSSSLPRKTTS